MSVFDYLDGDGCRHPFVGDIRDLSARQVRARLRISQEEATRVGLGEIPVDLEDPRWWQRWYPARPEDGSIDVDRMSDEEWRAFDGERARRNRLVWEQVRYVVPEGGGRARRRDPVAPRWVDEVVGLQPVPGFSLGVRGGFLTLVDRGGGPVEAWVVGLVRVAGAGGGRVLVVERGGVGWALWRADREAWPDALRSVAQTVPQEWLEVDAVGLGEVPWDLEVPVLVPRGPSCRVRIATRGVLREAFGPRESQSWEGRQDEPQAQQPTVSQAGSQPGRPARPQDGPGGPRHQEDQS